MSIFQSFFKTRGGDFKKKGTVAAAWVIAAVIAMIAVSSLYGGADDEKSETAKEDASDLTAAYDYISREEKNLSEKLSRVRGAGNVTVAVTIKNYGESVPAKNISTSSEQSGGEENNSSSREEEVVLKGSGGDPVILSENMPEVSGVIVISSGAANEGVKNELYESVKALYGIPSHRIKILEGN